MNPEATREIFWNIPHEALPIFYGLALVSTGLFAWGWWRRWRTWARGGPRPPIKELGPRLKDLLVLGLGQAKLFRERFGGWMHAGLLWGFLVLLYGTTVVALEYDFGLGIFQGTFYLVTSFLCDIFGLFFLGALLAAGWRRFLIKPDRLDRSPEMLLIWLGLVLITATGFLVEALRILGTGKPAFEVFSPVGYSLAGLIQALGASLEAVKTAHFGLWWLHALLVFGFIASIPFGMLRHLIAAPLNILFQSPERPQAMRLVSLEEVESTGRFGAGRLEDFSWIELLSLDACTECGRCQDACPANEAGLPLSPKALVLDLQHHMTLRISRGNDGSGLHGDTIRAETLWSCLTCRACVEECPVLIDQMSLILEMRRHLVGEGAVPPGARSTLMKLNHHGNVYGFAPEERGLWAEGLGLPSARDVPEDGLLLFVGCVSSYDRRAQRTVKALVEVLRTAGLEPSILGPKERCCGDPARRLGDEFLFQQLAQENIAAFREAQVRRIVTPCPHCYNILKNEYPQLGADFEVLHHSHLVASLLKEGRLRPKRSLPRALTYHDSCYLGRHNQTYEAPREAFRAATGGELLEMPLSLDRSFCCGGGGGHMWMEMDEEAERINQIRFHQALEVGATTIGTACPFCVAMLEDAGKVLDREDVEVRDFVELLAEALKTEETGNSP